MFHNGSTYDYHYVIEKLAEEVKGNFECLEENTGRYSASWKRKWWKNHI